MTPPTATTLAGIAWPNLKLQNEELRAKLKSAACRSLTGGCPPPTATTAVKLVSKAKCTSVRFRSCDRCGGDLFPDEDRAWLFCLQCGGQLRRAQRRIAPALR